MSYSKFIIESVQKEARTKFATKNKLTILDYSRDNSEELKNYAINNSAFILQDPLLLGWLVVKHAKN